MAAPANLELLWLDPGAALSNGEKELPTTVKSDEELAKYSVWTCRASSGWRTPAGLQAHCITDFACVLIGQPLLGSHRSTST